MTPGPISEKVVSERSEWIREMLERIRSLPLATEDEFRSESRNVDAAESCLRRALEALLDLGRHVLAKGFGDAPAEYAAVAERLGQHGVLGEDDTALLGRMARYRNRLVHFYDRVSESELYSLCTDHLPDVERLLAALHAWIRDHPERTERTL